ncbi:MAG: hypothetical protein HC906_19760 [Bacteroidales bacterium]|nr:hypothetical protein [Bacteroidales bacterium]
MEIEVVAPGIGETALLEIDTNTVFQTIRGLGACFFEGSNENLFIEMGSSGLRTGYNSIEPVNDNDDPYVINMDAINQDAYDWETFRYLQENGVESVILSYWWLENWMMENLVTSTAYPTVYWNWTGNPWNKERNFHIDPLMYEEFAENVIATVKLFRKNNINLKGISIQNEPLLVQAYGGNYLDPIHYAEVLKVVGKRLDLEGMGDVLLFGPEQFTVESSTGFWDGLKSLNDAEIFDHLDVFAVHGYGDDGIQPGIPSNDDWIKYNQRAVEKDKELWMTENRTGL